ncbi:MAG: ACT domain-containing protein [Oscillospiraceae bacterium]
MEAVITVVGKDMVGILAKVSGKCAEANVNVEEVTQSILKDTFAMIMLVEISKCNIDFTAFAKELTNAGASMGVDIHVTRQELFDAMHRI